MERIADPDNLRVAFWRAAKGKWARPQTRYFSAHLEERISELRTGLLDGTFPVGQFRRFTVWDPKERTIHAAAFPERVLHHAILAVCEPILEGTAVADSYACRVGKGRLAALERARYHASRNGYFLKMDVRKYFDSIDHDILLAALARKFKDQRLLDWFGRIVRGYKTGPGRGLPIGSLTSQHLANFYLGPLDRFALETIGTRGYVRYMDDFVLWHQDRQRLNEARGLIETMLREKLHLEVKPTSFINRTGRGMDFLGFRVFPQCMILARKSRVRLVRKWKRLEGQFSGLAMSERAYQARSTALFAFTQHAECEEWRRRLVFPRLGSAAIRLEPCESRGLLEQQRVERQPALREPQQQHAVESQQQHRLPPRPSSAAPRQNRPPTCSRICGTNWSQPSGAGSSADAESKAPGGIFFPNY